MKISDKKNTKKSKNKTIPYKITENEIPFQDNDDDWNFINPKYLMDDDVTDYVPNKYYEKLKDYFYPGEIFTFYFNEIKPEKAIFLNTKYNFNEGQIIIFEKYLTLDRPIEKLNTSKLELLGKVLKVLYGIWYSKLVEYDNEDFPNYVNAEEHETVEDYLPHFLILGEGKSGIVVTSRYNNTVWKFIDPNDINCDEFYLTIDCFERATFIKFNYIMTIWHEAELNEIGGQDMPSDIICLVMDRINGITLKEKLDKYSSLTAKDTIKYGLDILKGIIEMRSIEIMFHEDLNPTNIIIEEYQNYKKATIIDFTSSTTSNKPLAKRNRRYGGHDLMSLGQILYKMNTGKHLFLKKNDSESTNNAIEIKKNREKFIINKFYKLFILNKIDHMIKDKVLNIFIKKCLLTNKYGNNILKKTQKEILYLDKLNDIINHLSISKKK